MIMIDCKALRKTLYNATNQIKENVYQIQETKAMKRLKLLIHQKTNISRECLWVIF